MMTNLSLKTFLPGLLLPMALQSVQAQEDPTGIHVSAYDIFASEFVWSFGFVEDSSGNTVPFTGERTVPLEYPGTNTASALSEVPAGNLATIRATATNDFDSVEASAAIADGSFGDYVLSRPFGQFGTVISSKNFGVTDTLFGDGENDRMTIPGQAVILEVTDLTLQDNVELLFQTIRYQAGGVNDKVDLYFFDQSINRVITQSGNTSSPYDDITRHFANGIEEGDKVIIVHKNGDFRLSRFVFDMVPFVRANLLEPEVRITPGYHPILRWRGEPSFVGDGNLGHYTVSRSENPESGFVVIEEEVEENTFIDESAELGKLYYYRVTATNASRDETSGFGNTASTTTFVNPPRGLSAQVSRDGSEVALDWEDTGTWLGSYTVLRREYFEAPERPRVRLEAEDATLVDGTVFDGAQYPPGASYAVKNRHRAGEKASGGLAVRATEQNGTFNVTFNHHATAGDYELIFRVCSDQMVTEQGMPLLKMRVVVNEVKLDDLLYCTSPTWAQRSFVVSLNDGTNAIELWDSRGTREPFIDYLDIVDLSSPPPAGPDFEIVASGLVESSYLDQDVIPGMVYQYALLQTDELGNASERSPFVESEQLGVPFLDPIYEVEATFGQVWKRDNHPQPDGKETNFKFHSFVPVGVDFPGKLPCLIFFPGGGGNINTIVDRAQLYAPYGFVVFVGDRGSSISANVPIHYPHVADFIRYVRDNAETYNIDPERIAAGGTSYGAVISMAYFFQGIGTQGPNTEVRALVVEAGRTDPSLIDENVPPTLAFHGETDPTIPFQFGVEIWEALDAAEVPNKFVVAPNRGHEGLGVLYNLTTDGKTHLEHVTEFLYEHMDLGALHPHRQQPSAILIGEEGEDTTVSIKSYDRFQYQIMQSPDLKFWTRIGDPIPGDGSVIGAEATVSEPRSFYRWEILPDFYDPAEAPE